MIDWTNDSVAVRLPRRLEAGAHDVSLRNDAGQVAARCGVLLTNASVLPGLPDAEPKPVATHRAFRYDGVGASTGHRGQVPHLTCTYDPVLQTFSAVMNVRTDAGQPVPDGIKVIVTDGHQPVHHAPDELAQVFVDLTGEEPIATAYTYNGKHDGTSWKDGSPEAGLQTGRTRSGSRSAWP